MFAFTVINCLKGGVYTVHQEYSFRRGTPSRNGTIQKTTGGGGENPAPVLPTPHLQVRTTRSQRRRGELIVVISCFESALYSWGISASSPLYHITLHLSTPHHPHTNTLPPPPTPLSRPPYRAIKLNLTLFRWGRALDLAVKYRSHVDTVLGYRLRHLEEFGKTEKNAKFLQYSGQVSSMICLPPHCFSGFLRMVLPFICVNSRNVISATCDCNYTDELSVMKEARRALLLSSIPLMFLTFLSGQYRLGCCECEGAERARRWDR